MTCKRIFFSLFFIHLLFISFDAVAQGGGVSDSIIKKVIAFKKQNKPDNFEIKAYNKLIITANPDSIEGRIDSVFVYKNEKRIFKSLDSSDYRFKKIISKQHLYLAEKITSYLSINNTIKESIKATKMAGFKEPVFEYFALELQPFSIYDNKFTLVEKEYISPISNKGLGIYEYTLIETLQIDQRKIYKIAFQAIKDIKKNKLKGFLYIDVQNYSVAKIEMNVMGIVKIKAVHTFTYNKELQNWFLFKNTLSIKKGTSKSPIKILGETITFEGNDSKLNPDKKKYASDFIEINTKTDFYNPQFNIKKNIKNQNIAIEIDKNAIGRKEDYWYTFFKDSVDPRSKLTYVSLDSLAEKRRIENKIRIGRKVINGYYPVSIFDIDLRYILKFNNYEGFRLGMGGITNEKLSKRFRLEGYGAYGTRDGRFKGSMGSIFRIENQNDTWLGSSYTDDLKEIASTSFEVDKRDFKFYDSRPINVNTFYDNKTWKVFVETNAIAKTQSIFQISRSQIVPKFNYQFDYQGNLYSNYVISLLTASFQFNPFSKFMQTPSTRIEIEKNFPKFTFEFSNTIPKLMGNNFDFGKIDFRAEYEKKLYNDDKILLLFEGGYAYGDVPITHVFNHSPNSLKSSDVFEKATIAGSRSFETMFSNEFFSNKYFLLQAKYQFPKFTVSKNIKPVVLLTSRYGWGELDNASKHLSIDYKTLEKGYLESGIEINQIYYGLGLVVFYRYGANHLPNFADNIALNLSFEIDLGF